jgi:hypothetical protein
VTLEELIRQACDKGITHLSLAPTPSEDGKKVYWRAQATPSTAHKYIAVNHTDPVEAMTQVLANLPKAPRRKAATKEAASPIFADSPDVPPGGTSDGPPAENEITATVTAADMEIADQHPDWMLKP